MFIVKLIKNRKLNEAKNSLIEKLHNRAEKRLIEEKKHITAKLSLVEREEQLDEAPRIKIVKARIRKGKIQRRKKVSNVKGFTMRGGKLTRMSVTERRHRKLGQRRGKMKRKAKMGRALRKRKLSLMKRKRMGIK